MPQSIVVVFCGTSTCVGKLGADFGGWVGFLVVVFFLFFLFFVPEQAQSHYSKATLTFIFFMAHCFCFSHGRTKINERDYVGVV